MKITGIRLDLGSAMSANVDLHTAMNAYPPNPSLILEKGKKAGQPQKITTNRITSECNNINTVIERGDIMGCKVFMCF
jgi:hypothetical protein